MNGSEVTFGNLDDWRVDPNKARNGVPFDMGLGRALIVRRANLYDREVQAHFESVDTKDMRAVQRVFASHLVVGWSGIVDGDGNPMDYTVDRCLAMFEQAPDVWEQVNRFAVNRANYRAETAQGDTDAVKTSRDGATVQAPTANS